MLRLRTRERVLQWIWETYALMTWRLVISTHAGSSSSTLCWRNGWTVSRQRYSWVTPCTGRATWRTLNPTGAAAPMATTVATTPNAGKKASKANAASPSLNNPVLIPAAKSMMFETESNSPFQDGYSITGERAVLAEFLADPQRKFDENDPLYDRHIELIDREDQLDRMKAKYQSSKGADPVVEHKEAVAMNFLGSLVDDGVDQMSLHTKEAFRMFMGRSRDPEKQLQPIIGGKRVAAALRALWVLTGNDNPYADWGLLRHEQTIKELGRLLSKHIADAQAALDQQKTRGLTFSVLQSSSPQVLNLGFKSPYGYAVAHPSSDDVRRPRPSRHRFPPLARSRPPVRGRPVRSDPNGQTSPSWTRRQTRHCGHQVA